MNEYDKGYHDGTVHHLDKIDRLTAQLAKYKGGVEVEGVIVHVTDWISTKSGLYFPLPEKPFAKGQRVHVHVMEVE